MEKSHSPSIANTFGPRSLSTVTVLTHYVLWDLFFNPKPQLSDEENVHGTIEINFSGLVIDRNGHSIDAHLIAHLLEFEQQVRRAYSKSLSNSGYLRELTKLQPEILKIMLLHDEHGCQDVHVPPELRKLGPKKT